MGYCWLHDFSPRFRRGLTDTLTVLQRLLVDTLRIVKWYLIGWITVFKQPRNGNLLIVHRFLIIFKTIFNDYAMMVHQCFIDSQMVIYCRWVNLLTSSIWLLLDGSMIPKWAFADSYPGFWRSSTLFNTLCCDKVKLVNPFFFARWVLLWCCATMIESLEARTKIPFMLLVWEGLFW